MVGLVIALGWHMFFRGKVDVAGPPGDAAPGDQKAEGAESYGWLVQAMAECEEEAKRATDKLYFLIAPVARAPKNVMGWHPGRIGMIGETTELLPSTDAVIGLRNGALTLYREPLAFAVSDPATLARASTGARSMTRPNASTTRARVSVKSPERSSRGSRR